MNIDANRFESKTLLHHNRWYSITINPDDKHQYYVPPNKMTSVYKERLSKFKHYWNNMFTEIFTMFDIDYDLVLEISEPLQKDERINHNTSLPRLHFHGKVRFRTIDSILEFLLVNVKVVRSVATMVVKPIQDDQWEKDYCTKQEYLGLGTLNNMPLHYSSKEEWYQDIFEEHKIQPPRQVKRVRKVKKTTSPVCTISTKSI